MRIQSFERWLPAWSEHEREIYLNHLLDYFQITKRPK